MTTSESTKSAPKYEVGDEVTASRGINRGRVGKVLEVDTATEQYAVKFCQSAEGLPNMAVVNFGNVKDPTERTYTRDEILELIDSVEDLDGLVAALNETPAF